MNDGMDALAGHWQALNKFWVDFGTKMATASMTASPGAPPTEATRAVRDAMFKAMAEWFDEYLRSPEFLELTKKSMDASLLVRRQMHDVLTQTRHELQGTAREDIDVVLRSLKHMEKRLLDRLEDLEHRVDDLATRVERRRASSGGRRSARASAKKPEEGAES